MTEEEDRRRKILLLRPGLIPIRFSVLEWSEIQASLITYKTLLGREDASTSTIEKIITRINVEICGEDIDMDENGDVTKPC